MSTITLISNGFVIIHSFFINFAGEERPSVIKAIEEARAHGDISENAEYEAAKERQGMIEARIADIQGKLAGAEG